MFSSGKMLVGKGAETIYKDVARTYGEIYEEIEQAGILFCGARENEG